MKKNLLSLFFAAFPLAAIAQLPNGSTAPNFTTTDLNGVQHNLYEYLDAGKTVLLDISATWCGPCWSYHATNALEDFHFAYGPGGSNEAVVLFVEGDGSTPISALYGTGNTQGDWVTGHHMPISDNASIASLYQITYFPTLFRICPSKISTVINTQQLSALRNSIQSGCGTQLVGTPNQVRIRTTQQRICGQEGNLSFSFKNLSNHAITNSIIQLKQNGTVIATREYSGNLASFGATNLAFNDVDFANGTDNLEIDVLSVNGNEPFNELISKIPADITSAPYINSNQIVAEIHLDQYATEARWEILSSNNAIVASGGPYTNADANTTKTVAITLPNTADCYSVKMYDSYGDGWGYGTTPHGITIKHNNQVVSSHLIGNFGSSLTVSNSFHTDAALSNDEFTVVKMGLYPNPSTGIFFLVNDFDTTVTVTDISGKTVWTANNLTDNSAIDLSHLAKGIYMAKLESAQGTDTQKIIIK